MDSNTFITWFLIILFGMILLTGVTIAIVAWNRRKLKFANFLDNTGTWIRESRKSFPKTFIFKGEEYDYSIIDCTRDNLNRPVAHYIKGNRNQLNFKNLLSSRSSVITIGSNEVTSEDIQTHMKTKIWKDIFSDDELVTYAIITIILIVLVAIVLGFMIATHKQDIISCQPVRLANDSLEIIKQYCCIKGVGKC